MILVQVDLQQQFRRANFAFCDWSVAVMVLSDDFRCCNFHIPYPEADPFPWFRNVLFQGQSLMGQQHIEDILFTLITFQDLGLCCSCHIDARQQKKRGDKAVKSTKDHHSCGAMLDICPGCIGLSREQTVLHPKGPLYIKKIFLPAEMPPDCATCLQFPSVERGSRATCIQRASLVL